MELRTSTLLNRHNVIVHDNFWCYIDVPFFDEYVYSIWLCVITTSLQRFATTQLELEREDKRHSKHEAIDQNTYASTFIQIPFKFESVISIIKIFN